MVSAYHWSPLIQKSITTEAPTDMKFYYQWRNNFSLKTFTRGRKQYAHYKTPEKNMSTEKNNFEVGPRDSGMGVKAANSNK